MSVRAARTRTHSPFARIGLLFVDPPTPPATGTVPSPNPPVPSANTPPPQGFPANTPVAEMTTEQQAAYWKDKARKHEERANARSDYDALKAKADQFDAAQRAAETEHEKALREARDAALAEGRAAAATESNEKAVRAILDAGLRARGITEDADRTARIGHLNLASFVKDNDVDSDAIAAYLDQSAGQPGTGRNPDYGQGNRGNSGAPKAGQAGADEAARRFGKPNDARVGA